MWPAVTSMFTQVLVNHPNIETSVHLCGLTQHQDIRGRVQKSYCSTGTVYRSQLAEVPRREVAVILTNCI